MASYVKPLLAVIAMSVVQTVAQGQNANQAIHGHHIALESFCVLGEPLSATETLDYEPTDGASDPVPMHREATLYWDSEGRADGIQVSRPAHRRHHTELCLSLRLPALLALVPSIITLDK
jgi:hypothetical protein